MEKALKDQEEKHNTTLDHFKTIADQRHRERMAEVAAHHAAVVEHTRAAVTAQVTKSVSMSVTQLVTESVTAAVTAKVTASLQSVHQQVVDTLVVAAIPCVFRARFNTKWYSATCFVFFKHRGCLSPRS